MKKTEREIVAFQIVAKFSGEQTKSWRVKSYEKHPHNPIMVAYQEGALEERTSLLINTALAEWVSIIELYS